MTMPKTITTTVYSFRELVELGNETATDRAKQWIGDIATEGPDWHDYLTSELWPSALAQIGFENASINFSGFWSQGDGASFTARVDVAKLVAFLVSPPQGSKTIAGEPEDFRPWLVKQCGGVSSYPSLARLLRVLDAGELRASVDRTSHHYSHENTCRLTVEGPRRRAPKVERLVFALEEAAERLRYDLCRAIYRSLGEEYDNATSDESLGDLADANDWLFDCNGKAVKP